jgi:hypothetical protein
MTEISAITDTKSVDHTALKIRNVKLPMPAIKSNVAQRCARICSTIQLNLRKYLGSIIVCSRQHPDCARAAAISPHTEHPIRVVRRAMKPKRRSGGQIDIRRIGIVEGDTEDLTNLASGHNNGLGGITPRASVWRPTRMPNVNKTPDSPLNINNNAPLLPDCPGESRDEGVAALHHLCRKVIGCGGA